MFDDLHDPDPPTSDSKHFAAVAARARQMRMRRWTVSTTAAIVSFGLGVGVVVSFGDDNSIETDQATTTTVTPTTEPSDTTTTTTTSDEPTPLVECPAVPDGLTLTGAVGDQVVSITGDHANQIEVAPSTPVTRAIHTDDAVWVETGTRHDRRIARIDAQDGAERVASGDVRLADVGAIDGQPFAVYIDFGGSDDEPESEFDPTGDVWLVNGTGDPNPTLLDEAPDGGRGAVQAHIGGDVVAVSELLDPDARFRYLTPSGDEVGDVYNPTDRGPDQNSGMIAESAVIAPDRSTVAWVEAEPLAGGVALGPWSLVVADGADGTERLRLRISDRGESLIHADYDGRYWVGTFGTMPMDASVDADRDPDRTVVVDTQAQNPETIELGCEPPTVLSIDRSTSGSQPGGTTTTTSPPDTSTPPGGPAAIECPSLPDRLALTAAMGGEAWSVTNTGAEQLYVAGSTIGVGRAVRGEDGTIWVSDGEGTMARIRRITPDGEIHDSEVVNSDSSGGLYLSHVGTIDGRTVATYINGYNLDDTEEYGDVWLEYSDGERASLGPAGMPEYGVLSAAPADPAIVLGASADLGEAFRYLNPDGSDADGSWYNPSYDPSLYNQPPWFESPMLSPDGSRQAWAEGPDYRGEDPSTLVGEWELVVAQTGPDDELLRVQVGGNAEALVAADYDGRYWVGTFGDRTGPGIPDPFAEPARTVVVDTQADDPQPIDVECAPAAEVMIDRAASSDGEPDGETTMPPPPECTVDPQAPEITENVDAVPPPQQLDGANWVYGGDSNYDPCAPLTYARVDVAGGTGSSPVQVMLFHEGEFVGTATECAFGFTSVTATTSDSVTVQYLWPREGDPNAAPSGSATVTYRWDGDDVATDGELPAELLQLNGCGS